MTPSRLHIQQLERVAHNPYTLKHIVWIDVLPSITSHFFSSLAQRQPSTKSLETSTFCMAKDRLLFSVSFFANDILLEEHALDECALSKGSMESLHDDLALATKDTLG